MRGPLICVVHCLFEHNAQMAFASFAQLATNSHDVGDQLAQLAKIGDRLATGGDPFGDISPNDCAQIGSGLHIYPNIYTFRLLFDL